MVAGAWQNGREWAVERREDSRIQLLADQDRQRHHLGRFERGHGRILRHGLADREPGLRDPEPAREGIHHALVGGGEQAVEDFLRLGGRRALPREYASGGDPLPLHLAEGLDRGGEELPRLGCAQRTNTCSGSRPLARSFSIG